MRTNNFPTAIGTLLGTCGTGLAMAIPEYKWIGWAVVALAFAVFIFQVRVENGGLRAQLPRGPRMFPLIGMIASALAFIGFGLWYHVSTQEGLGFEITEVIFDPNGPGEFYVAFRIANLGLPTTIEGWNLSIERSGITLLSGPPRVTFSPTFNSSTGRLDPPKDLSKTPVQTGEQLNPRFTWTYAGNAKQDFGHPGTRFVLSARDIRRRELRTEYIIP